MSEVMEDSLGGGSGRPAAVATPPDGLEPSGEVELDAAANAEQLGELDRALRDAGLVLRRRVRQGGRAGAGRAVSSSARTAASALRHSASKAAASSTTRASISATRWDASCRC